MGQTEAKFHLPLDTKLRVKKPFQDNSTKKGGALKLVLVGPRGSGKSSVANCILGRKVFKAAAGTRTCQVKSCKVDNCDLTVFDTPGLSGEKDVDDEVTKGIMGAFKNSPEIPVIFLLVLPLGWNEEKSVAFQHMLSKVWLEQAMVLVTYTKTLEQDENLLEDLGTLKPILDLCGGRFCSFNITEKDRTQVSELLKKLQSMVKGLNVQREDATPAEPFWLKGTEEQVETEARSDECGIAEENVTTYRAAILHQTTRLAQCYKLINNSQNIIAENKKQLQGLRDEIENAEEEVRAALSEEDKQVLKEKIQEKEEGVKATEEKIKEHILILQTLQEQVKEKQQEIQTMERSIKEREKKQVPNREVETLREKAELEPELEPKFQKDSGEKEKVDITSGGMYLFKRNLQQLEEQIKSKREREEEMARERNLEYKAQLQKLRDQIGTRPT